RVISLCCPVFLNASWTTQHSTLSLHDALPILLMTSCQVSLNPNKGPVIAHARMTVTAPTKAAGLPVTRAVHFAARVNQDLDYSRSEEHTSELQSRFDLVCRLLLEKKKTKCTPS